MPAMTMEFNVSDKKIISNLKRGDKVKFQVNKELELIKIESK
jgi:Cu/Ag efflux protein CusF